MSPTLIAVGILLVAAVAVVAYFAANASRKRKAYERVPPAMRPGYSDEQLEKSVLERYMAWGVVLTVFFALFFPVYWFNEPNRLNQAQEGFFIEDVVRGEDEYQQLCARCHGPTLGGGAAPSPYVGEDGQASAWPAPALNNIVSRYEDNRNITDIRDFVRETIDQGRPGTPMPTWGAAYGGPLTDQQVENITDYILSQQTGEETEATAAADLSGQELYSQNCVKCHGENFDAEPGRPGVSLVGVFERHSQDTVLGILRNGIYVPTGTMMPPWQNGYMYPDARYSDEALTKIIDYLQSEQPAGADAEAGGAGAEQGGAATGEQGGAGAQDGPGSTGGAGGGGEGGVPDDDEQNLTQTEA